MPAYVTQAASGKLASYDGETMIAMHVDTDGKAAIEAAALANGTVDIATLSELTSFELARTTFTAEADATLGKIDVAADEDPFTDTDGETVAGVVIATQAGGSDAARTVVACHTFTPRAGNAADAIVFANETGFGTWTPAPGAIVRGIGTVRPDAEGIIDDAELSALLGTGGSGTADPIFVTAAPSSTVDLEDHYSAGRPVVVTIEGTSEETRPEVLWGDPADHVGQVVIHLPARSITPIYGASVGWHIGATPGVLGDFGADAYTGGFGDLDFASSPETFEITVDGSPYTASLSADYTGDTPGLITALLGGWLTDGAPVSAELAYEDVIGSRLLAVALVTTTTGDSSTIEVTDAGTGDRLNLLSLTATDGLDSGHEGYNGSLLGTGELNAGQSNTHSWFDNAINALKSLVVMSDGTQWASVVRRHDAPMVPYGPVTPADWTEGVPSYVGNALDILAARAGGGGGGSVATDSLWDASGDLAVGSGANTAAKLTKGTSGTFLKAGASTLSWESVTKTDVGLANVTNDAQLKVASNLSDLASASTARNNLEATGTLAHRDGTTALTGTTTPTSLLASTITVPTMPVGSTLTVDVWGRYLNNTGANRSATVGVKLGSSTMIEMIPTGTGLIGSNASDREWSCTFICQLVGSSDVDAVGRSTAIGSTAAPNIVRNTTATAMQSGGTLDVIGTHSAATAAEIQVYGCVAKLSTPRS